MLWNYDGPNPIHGNGPKSETFTRSKNWNYKNFPKNSIQILPLSPPPPSNGYHTLSTVQFLSFSLSRNSLSSIVNPLSHISPLEWSISWCPEIKSWEKIMTLSRHLRTLNRSRPLQTLAIGSSNPAKRTRLRHRRQIRTPWHRLPQPRWRVHFRRGHRSSASSVSSLWHPRIVRLPRIH